MLLTYYSDEEKNFLYSRLFCAFKFIYYDLKGQVACYNINNNIVTNHLQLRPRLALNKMDLVKRISICLII